MSISMRSGPFNRTGYLKPLSLKCLYCVTSNALFVSGIPLKPLTGQGMYMYCPNTTVEELVFAHVHVPTHSQGCLSLSVNEHFMLHIGL